MAHRSLFVVFRKCHRLGVAVVVTAAVSVLTLQGAPPAHADIVSDIRAAQAQLSRSQDQTEAITEKYNAARIALRKAQRDQASAQQRVQDAAQRSAASNHALASVAAAVYRGGSTAQINALFDSGAQDYIERAVMLNTITRQQTALIANARVVATQQTQAEQLAADLGKQAQAIVTGLQRQRDSILAGMARQQTLLNTLVARERELAAQARSQAARDLALARAKQFAVEAGLTGSGFGGGVDANVPSGSGGVSTALQWARQELGKPYVYGAAGPDSYDCSGLTQYVFAKGGIALDHYTGSQWNSGPHVAREELRPGDLVFFYSDLHHVGIYVGNGQMIDAPHSGANVRQEGVWWSDYQGAVRVGG